MARDPFQKARELPMSGETWLGTVRLGRAWVTPDQGAPYRPYVTVFIDQERARILGMKFTDDRPEPEWVLGQLLQAMSRPVPGAGRPRRPARLLIDDAEIAEVLAPRLAELGVECQFHAVPLVDRVLREMEALLTRREPRPGLLQIPGVTPYMVEGLYRAAASFYQQAPWQWISDSVPMEVRYPPQGKPRYAVVMGHGGETYGLAMYESPEHLRLIYSGVEPEQLLGRISGGSVVFGPAIDMAYDDLDDIARYGWPVAGESAYPLLFYLSPDGEMGLPTRTDLLWFEAALLAIPVFVREHMRAHEGAPRPAEATLTVAAADGPTEIYLRYPTPGFDARPPDVSWLLNPPRRPRRR